MVKALHELPDLTTLTPDQKDALIIALYRRVRELEAPPIQGQPEFQYTAILGRVVQKAHIVASGQRAQVAWTAWT